MQARSQLILTIDQGTSRQKVALFDLSGQLVAQQVGRNAEFSRDNFSWQSAEAWWQSASSLIASLPGRADIVAVSLSGRASAAVFVDQAGLVVADPWLDQRHLAQLTNLRQTRPDLSLYGATLIAKYQWLLENQPEIAATVSHVLYAKDFLVFRLTDNAVTDPASGPDQMAWPEGINDLDINPDCLPAISQPWDVAGALSRKTAKTLGLKPGLPVVTGAHDGICANIGAGMITEGQLVLTLGTHGVTRGLIKQEPREPMLRFYGFPQDLHVVGANAFMAGRCIEWCLDLLSAGEGQTRTRRLKQLEKKISQNEPGAKGALFFPYPDGQISPVRRQRRAGFAGLGLEHDRLLMFQAVMEGVSFAVAESFLQVRDWLGTPEKVGVTGGGANSQYWLQLLANVLDQPLTVTDTCSEGRGAAMLASIGLGIHQNLEEAVSGMKVPGQLVEPGVNEVSQYQVLFEAWQQAAASQVN